VLECQENVGCVESSGILLESANLRQIEEEFSTWAVFKHKEELGF
jgi:hypothetical protein